MRNQEMPPTPLAPLAPLAPLLTPRSGGTTRQLALPLPAVAPPDRSPPPLPSGVDVAHLEHAGHVRPRHVWARLPAPVQAAIRQIVSQVLEEALRHEHGQ